ncbi:MAG: hypothetical protein LKF06_10270 [Prevotella sp.]|nr:hypothetical protein [Prevotella sp.]MCH4017874.1 hypothetical protein [Prevotella sp.]MCH4100940.1 hypothetical protein [Prevotella sp.]MCI1349895.1 hypothetical protein [Prevotella sp.]
MRQEIVEKEWPWIRNPAYSSLGAMHHWGDQYAPSGYSVCTIGVLCMHHWGTLYAPLRCSVCTIEVIIDYGLKVR